MKEEIIDSEEKQIKNKWQLILICLLGLIYSLTEIFTASYYFGLQETNFHIYKLRFLIIIYLLYFIFWFLLLIKQNIKIFLLLTINIILNWILCFYIGINVFEGISWIQILLGFIGGLYFILTGR
jgi:cell division protein FtsW (lipid II flippase)